MNRILVIKLSSLGDIAHALPAVRALKVQTGAVLDWVVQPEYAPLLACCPDVDRTIAFPRRQFARGFLSFLRELRREKYDVIVDLQGLLKSAWVARLARGKRRVGPAWAREGAPRFYDEQPPKAARKHAVEEAMDVVKIVSPNISETPKPVLNFPALAPFSEPGPHVAFAPFSRWGTKNWPIEKFVELGIRLRTEMGCHICIVGSNADEAQGLALACQIGSSAQNLCGKTDLPELCSWLAKMDLLVSVDSGPLHWADAMGVPLVAVFGATNPARTGPFWQREHVVAQTGLECQPCHSRNCSHGDVRCLSTLEVDTVFQAVLRWL